MTSSEPTTAVPVAPAACFHCGLPIPRAADFAVLFEGVPRPMCCRGCQAVAQAIIDGGLADYYQHRTANPPPGQEAVPEILRRTAVFDHPQVQKTFVRRETGGTREAALILEGISCAACVWLNEQYLSRLPGVESAEINYSTRRARIRWDENRIRLSDILQAIQRIGYRAHPYDPARSQQLLEQERRAQLRRLGVAGVFGMQVMTLAVALYLGGSGMEIEFRTFFHWISLLLTLPILLYGARPFFENAWRNLRARRLGMDVPVSLGIAAAFAASAWATVIGEGAVYYDSVAMFVFFLLTARYFELVARKRTTEAAESMVHAMPAITTRLSDQDGTLHEQLVPVADLAPGDRVLVRPGENVPCDGVIVDGVSTVDESLITGECAPIAKRAGDCVIGGSINVDSPLVLRIERVGEDTVLAAIRRLLDRAQSEKPKLAQLADRVASWFVGAVLLLAGVVAWHWWSQGSATWLPITVAVLVVTCPCALSLATPTALTAATGSLTRLGLLATRGHALETLARATHFIFDKTGTLTRGQLRLLDVHPLGDLNRDECLRVAASLEQKSEHPIARAIVAAYSGPLGAVTQVSATAGAGLAGKISGEAHYLGTAMFIANQTGRAVAPALLNDLRRHGATVVLLATNSRLLAGLAFTDNIRPEASGLIATLKHQEKSVLLISGDHASAVEWVARTVGIDDFASDLMPADKLHRVQKLQQQGAVVAMIGDGVNDAPVLAAADVSVAMRTGAHLAAANADMLLMSNNLGHLAVGLTTAQKALRVIRQNFTWAVLYNLLAVPAAAAGYVAPWMAALGMSLSSLAVVINALRLIDKRKAPHDEADEHASAVASHVAR